MTAVLFTGIVLFVVTNAYSSTDAGRLSASDEEDATSPIVLRSSEDEYFDVIPSLESEAYKHTEALTESHSKLVFEELITVTPNSAVHTFETNSLSHESNSLGTNTINLSILMKYLLDNTTYGDLPSSEFKSLFSEVLTTYTDNEEISSTDWITSLQIRPTVVETNYLSTPDVARSLQIEPTTVKATLLPSVKKEKRLNVTSDQGKPEEEPNRNESLNIVNNFFKDLIGDLSFLLNGKNITKSMLDTLPYFKDDYTKDGKALSEITPYDITEQTANIAEFPSDVNDELMTSQNVLLSNVSPSSTTTHLASTNETENNFTSPEFPELDLQTNATVSSSKITPFVRENYLVLILRKNCTDENDFSEVIDSLNRTVLNAVLDLNKNMQLNCEKYFSLKFPIQNASIISDASAAQTMKFDPRLLEKFEIVRYFLNVSDHQNIPLFPPSETCDRPWESIYGREITIYIMATVNVSLLLIIIVGFFIRFLCRKQTNSLDLCDIPHLNLKLEDYKVTPIPRPTICMPDSNREFLHAYSETYISRPSRAEDTILTQHHFSGKSSNNLDIPVEQNHSAFPQELRTFGAKRSCSRVQSLDVKNLNTGYGTESWLLKNKGDKDLERGLPGIDNPLFRKW
ncbi:uncharacterized protein LOC118183719 isoform X2 [Stegodyphus dumicola]|nr:uncharacterized protein LOC118183719 isoform X2 [Stegodyphus dumicola]